MLLERSDSSLVEEIFSSNSAILLCMAALSKPLCMALQVEAVQESFPSNWASAVTLTGSALSGSEGLLAVLNKAESNAISEG